MTTGDNIRAKREEKRLTQRQLGKLVGVGASSICNWEKNNTSFSTKVLIELCKVFECTSDDLIVIE